MRYLILLFLLAPGCKHLCPVPPEPEPPSIVYKPCLIEPPAKWETVEILDPPGCRLTHEEATSCFDENNDVVAVPQCVADETITGCLDLENVIKMRRQIIDMKTWADMAWARCGDESEE